nr:alpha/beta family hydrolase [Methylomarinum sp. Ch1-1]MDP4519195.1 hypothetical protein [Methylomarinum sp. Ch1-1]
MKTETHKITVNPKAYVSSIWLIPEEYDSVLLIAPGAGKDMHSDLISHLHEGIAAHNIMTVKFNFPYLEQGRAAPNSPSILEDTWLAVINAVMALTGLPRKNISLRKKHGRTLCNPAGSQDGRFRRPDPLWLSFACSRQTPQAS